MALAGAAGLTAAEPGACVPATEATSSAAWAAGGGVERICMQDVLLQGVEATQVWPKALCAHSTGCMQQSDSTYAAHMQEAGTQ